MITLLVGWALAMAALAFVLFPLFRRDARTALPPGEEPPHGGEQGESAVAALREIEFDRATGKLSDSDYAALKARYTQEAVAQLRQGGAGPLELESGDAVEALISRFREQSAVCPEHGSRPEPGASYCSECGRYLQQRCASCGAHVTQEGARYCSSCGVMLAA